MKKYEGKNVPIKSWCNTPEEGAIEQAFNLTKLPFIFKQVCLMPDTHKGFGMPIGGVIATKDVVIPNAVGVDIGCFDKETEYLTPNGWNKFNHYNNELVMQYNPLTNKGTFIKPIRYIKEKCDKFISIKTKYGINQRISEEHRCLVYKYDSSYKFNKYKVVLAKDLMYIHNNLKNGYRNLFNTAFELESNKKVDLTNNEIRILVMICADGHIDKNRIVLQFKKERKIQRAKKLLEKSKISYNISFNKNNITRISFPKKNFNKDLSVLWKCNHAQLKVIVDEIFNWDGNIQGNCFYTRLKNEADFIQYAISATGKRAVLREDINKHDNKIDYRVFLYNKTKIGINGSPKTLINIVKSEDGYKYSFTVPTSFLVVRRKGNVFITGNCGMCAVRTSLTDITTEQLKAVMGEIRKRIPVGFNHQKEMQAESLMPVFLLDKNKYRNYEGDLETHLETAIKESFPIVSEEYNSARKQLGTLGGGNHFIEIQKGSDGYIWIMIHSGSRNLGLKVAKHYNKIAQDLCKKWHSNIPEYKGEDGLAFLPVDTKEAESYLREMRYCLKFAYANRYLMMDRIIDCFNKILLTDETIAYSTNMINIHHNYVSLENHFGENVWVHRKGATSAMKGEKGIIPGSQGTASYIVEGLGNRESFMSCSHGAGRKMGRKQAQRTLDLIEEQKRLDKQGIVHSIRSVKDLDEASGAYKDIDIVMEEQKDLVRVLAKLKPLGVIKG